MQAATNSGSLTMVSFGIGSPNAATIMDLLGARDPRGVLFLGKCGGLKHSTEIGQFILPIAPFEAKGPPTITCRPSYPPFPHSNFTCLGRKSWWNALRSVN